MQLVELLRRVNMENTFLVQKYVYSANHKRQLAHFLMIAIKPKDILKHLKKLNHGQKKTPEKLLLEHLTEMDTSKNEES